MAYREKEGAEQTDLGYRSWPLQTFPSALPQSLTIHGSAFSVDPDTVERISKLWPIGNICSKLFMYDPLVKNGFYIF